MDGHGGGADATADQNSVLDDARSSAPLFPKISPATPASSSVFGGPASLATPMVRAAPLMFSILGLITCRVGD